MILGEQNKRLTEDNSEYVKQMIDMKESRAKFINEYLSGKIPQHDVGEKFSVSLIILYVRVDRGTLPKPNGTRGEEVL